MNQIIAILSMLHESADRHSAARRFRGRPVLEWTLRRLSAASSIDTVAVLCWDDQLAAVNAVTDEQTAGVISKGPRQMLPAMAAITAARRWSDGWRSGLLGTCEFDLGFHPQWVNELIHLHDADAVLLVDPAAGLIDPVLVDSLVHHAEKQPLSELCFMQAAPGLAGTLLRRELVDRLSIADVYPGRLLTYYPDQHGVDPTGKPGCAPVPTPVARSLHRFKLDSDRQIARADRATMHLNGHLVSTDAEELVVSMRNCETVDRLPREVVLELNTTRSSNPAFLPGRHLPIARPDLSMEMAAKLFAELAAMDDIRLTLAGVGDPLLHESCIEIITAAAIAGIHTIHLETDLLSSTPEDLAQLADSAVDVVSVHFPAATAPTYTAMMGVDGFTRALENVRILEQQVKRAGRGTPLIAMLFTKTAVNLAEMESWYDYWIRRLGHAVILGPSDFGGQIPDLAVADMAPPRRKPCARLASRMTVLSDGRVVSCEQDFQAKQVMGTVGETPIQEIWQSRFTAMRQCHERGEWNQMPVCVGCREWHR
jgi:radical SAM protein with 4Fe4S-binding SPASM domain